MAITKNTVTRADEQQPSGSNNYTFPFGIDEATGKAPLYIEHSEPHPISKQPVRAVWEKTEMKGGLDGDLEAVETTYRIEVRDNGGNIIDSHTRRITEKTSDSDLVTFKRNLYPAIGPSTINLYFKGGYGPSSGFLGHAAHAPFVNGVFVPDADRPGVSEAAATWDYNIVPQL